MYYVMEFVMSHGSPALPPPPAKMWGGGVSVHDKVTFAIVCSPPKHEGTGTDWTGFSMEGFYPSACFF